MLHSLSPAEIATRRWPGILSLLGFPADFLSRKHGPCPMCGGHDRFRFDDKEGRGTWICNQCGAGDGYKLLEMYFGWGFKEALSRVSEVSGSVQIVETKKQDDTASRVASLKRVWLDALPLEEGDPVWRYLRARVGIKFAPLNVRHHPSLAYHHDKGVDYYPAMIAAITSPDGAGASIHRTYLTAAGTKAPVESAKKLMQGLALAGAAIRLTKPAEVMGVAEGIETALAASRLFSVPVWSCVSANGLASWEPPSVCKSVVVFGDNDASYTGQAAAYALAQRLKAKRLSVEVRIPKTVGNDWADETAEGV